ncbi:MAG: nucleotidyltransferase family protein [Ardenticatenia bacterium]|nr:nucleotidyltransferase family protein [Ardenticatenia bacterium]
MNRAEGPERTLIEKPLTREAVLHLLAQHREELRRRFRVKSLALFGSVARNEAGPESDVDILVAFEGGVGLFTFVQLKMYLESVLGHSVDLVTWDALRPAMRKHVMEELVYAT